ncbi:MAG TPA: hypothetical protein VGA13_11360 [Acidimicrobiales bacterium]|jgi:hypothetical protein
MATIRASCPDCGDIELTTRDVTVRVCSDDNQGSYTFRCPTCLLAVAKDAAPRIVDLLVSSGVNMVSWDLPAELSERHAGPALTHDDLLDFHSLLDADDFVDRLASSGLG